MKIVIGGFVGFVGTQLKSFFEQSGNQNVALKIRKETRLDAIVEAMRLSGEAGFDTQSRRRYRTDVYQ